MLGEQKINYLLNKFPGSKKHIKRVYQRTMYTFSRKIKSEGNIVQVSPNDNNEYFFGYYDKSPWDANDRYMLCMKAKNTLTAPDSDKPAQIIIIDTKKNNNATVIAETRSWNVQQGCMLQWLGGDSKDRIIYNDFRNGKYCSVILKLTFDNGNVKAAEEKVLPLPIYSVSSDGTFALTLDFSRLHRLRPGYGYCNAEESTSGEKVPDKPCIWKIDIETGAVTAICKYTDFANFEPRSEMSGAEHKVNHIMISPDGRRFMVLHRWYLKKRKYSRLVTCNIDGSEMYNLSDDDMVSHCCWKDNEYILAFENKKNIGTGYYLMKDKTHEFKRLFNEIDYDGHPSYSPDGGLIVFDSYPDRARLSSVMIGREDGSKTTTAKVFAPFKYDNDLRCDLHPRWNRKGNMICFDSVFQGNRRMYTIKLNDNLFGSGFNGSKIKIAYVFTSCKHVGPIQQMYNLIRRIDRDVFEPILITIYDEPTDGSSQLGQYLKLNIRHYYCPLSKKDIILEKTQKLEKLLTDINADVIHSMGVFPDYAVSKMQTGKQIITLRNYVWEDYPAKFGKMKGSMLAAMHLYAMKKTAVTVTCSESLSHIYKKKLGLDYNYVCNGVNVDRYERAAAEEKIKIRAELNIPEKSKVLIYSGQMIERKNQRFLLETFFERHKDDMNYYLILLGDGAEYNNLYESYNEVPNIDFRGSVANVEDYLKAADLYVSTSRSEGMPNGVLEAMAAAVPVVLSDIPQHKELLKPDKRAGVLYKRDNKDDLDKKIQDIFRSDMLIRSDAAYETAHGWFSDKRMSESYQELYCGILNQNIT